MSALGHKRTYAVQKVMSALPPKADMCGATRCPLWANSGHRWQSVALSNPAQVWLLSARALREVSPHDRFGDARRLVLPLDFNGDVAGQLQAAVDFIYLCEHETST